MNKKFFGESGQASRMLLVLAIVVFVAGIIVFIILRAAQKPPAPSLPVEEVPKAVYQVTLGDIKFTFQDAVDMGNILKGAKSRNPQYQKDLTSTERFIAVTIGAQNQGKENVPERVWDLKNIIDSEGREFVPMDAYIVGSWLPDPNLCQDLLKPAFTPIPCAKVYEVSKLSKNLKIQVTAQEKSGTGYSSAPNSLMTGLIDLIVTPQ